MNGNDHTLGYQMNLYLWGFMGTGKTTIGNRLATALQLKWIDLDHFIVSHSGKTIPALFQERGEIGFREIEHACLKEICRLTGYIVTTGGGSVIQADNRKLMKASGRCITLTASLECIWKRIQYDTDRPLLQHPSPKEHLAVLLQERESFYNEADRLVNTGNRSIDDVIAEIMAYLNSEVPSFKN
jgi:shikimate kinase